MVVVGPGGGGLEERRSPCPMEELDAVDVVSFALAVVSLGSKALVSDSILAAMAHWQDVDVDAFLNLFFLVLRGGM